MKTFLLSAATGIAAFAAGWLLKPVEGPRDGEAGNRTPLAKSAVTVAVLKPGDRVTPEAGRAGAEPVITPFTSLDEIIGIMEELLGDDGAEELTMVESLAALPRLMATDLASVRRLLESLGGTTTSKAEVRMMTAAMLTARWILQDPENGTGFMLANPDTYVSRKPSAGDKTELFGDDDLREGLMMMGVALSARKDPGAARRLLSLLPGDGPDDLRGLLAQMEAREDPAAFLTTSPPEKLKELNDLTPVLARWARQDPAAAAKWAESRPETETDEWAAIGKAWARKDRAAAIAWAGGLADETRRQPVLMQIAEQAVEGLDPAAAEKELAGFPESVADTVRIQQLGESGDSPAQSASLLAEMAVKYANDSDMATTVSNHVQGVVKRLIEQENGTSHVTAWLGTLPDGDARSRAAVILMDKWAEDDPAAASAWLKAQPAGPLRDGATAELVGKITSDDPAGALEWARTLTDEDKKNEHMQAVFRDWLPKEPQKAMQALQALPAEQQSALFAD